MKRGKRERWGRPALEHLESRNLPAGHTLAAATPLTFRGPGPAEAHGFLAGGRQVDLYRVLLNAGDRLSASVRDRAAGSGLQSQLRLFTAFGSQVASNGQEGGDPKVTFQAAAAGYYFVGVSAAGNLTYDPRIAGSGTP